MNDPRGLLHVLLWLRATLGLTTAGWSAERVHYTILRAMDRVGVADGAAYCRRLSGCPPLADELVDELTVKESYFFRQPEHFEWLRREHLPDLARRLGPSRKPRLWSAGCANGEEAYSLAVTTVDAGVEGAYILGTDVSRGALERARRGVYGTWSLSRPSTAPVSQDVPWRLRRHLVEEGCRWRVSRRLQERVLFARQNLAEDSYPSSTSGIGEMDAILCRNVLIYFDPETVRAVARRLYACLSAGGCLLTAASDPPLQEHAPFELLSTEHGTIYRRAGGRARSVSIPSVPSSPSPSAVPAKPRTVRPNRVGARPKPVVATAQNHRPVAEATRADDEASEQARRSRVLADRRGSRVAEPGVRDLLERFPLSTDLHFLHALLLLDLGRLDEAARAVRSVLFLDPSLAVAHFLAGTVWAAMGRAAEARRAFRNAAELCARRPPEEVLPLGERETAGGLARAALAALAPVDGGARA